MTVSIVIGSGWGDEGKGLVTDYLCDDQTLNIRFNGGSQAGHTVVSHKTGIRHVFSHLGAGTFSSARTYLSSKFIVNPMIFRHEARIMDKKPYIDPLAKITTPYDVMANQELEKKRGKDHHGSCGLGIFQTIQRSWDKPFPVESLYKHVHFEYLVRRIRDHYRKFFNDNDIQIPEYFYDENLLYNFINDCEFLRSNCVPLGWRDINNWSGDIVFEGAQGLELDMGNEEMMPYLTPSHTGLIEPLQMLNSLEGKIETVDVYYVTRIYTTRHGAGPLPHECEKPYSGIVDGTNIRNKYQGDLRFGVIDLNRLDQTISKDFSQTLSKSQFRFKKHIVITCVDQIDGNEVKCVLNDQHKTINLDRFIDAVDHFLRPDSILISNGPTKACVGALDMRKI